MHQGKQSWEKWMRWEQHANQSSPSTTAVELRWLLACLLVTVFHLALSAYIPPSPDELYYWSWSQHLQWSYFDHPPMIAWLVALSTSIFGNNIVGIRLVGIALTFAILLILGTVIRGRQMRLVLLFTPTAMFASVITTPDVPLLFFWLTYIVWANSINQRFQDWNLDPVARVYHKMPVPWGQWAAGGAILGLGILSKYTMFLAIPIILVLLSSNYRWRAWLSGFSLHLGIAAIFALPILIYNIQHDFLPLSFQWHHSVTGTGFSFSNLMWFFGEQSLLSSPLPILLLPWILTHRSRFRNVPYWQTCLWFFALPFVLFSIMASRARLEGNWALVSYLAFWPLVQTYFDHTSFRVVAKNLYLFSMAALVIVDVVILIYCFSSNPAFVSPEKDRLNQMRSYYELSKTIAKETRALTTTQPLYLPTYQWTAYMRYQHILSEQIIPTGRLSHFTLQHPEPVCSNSHALVLQNSPYREPAMKCFLHQRPIKEFPLMVRGKLIGTMQIMEYYGH